MTKKIEKGISDVAERMIRAYRGYLLSPDYNHIEDDGLSNGQMEEILKEGSLENMVFPVFCADVIEGRGYEVEAEKIRDFYFESQMENLKRSVGEKVDIHFSRVLTIPSRVHLGGVLKTIKPLVNLETGYKVYNFLGANKEGICAVENSKGEYLFVNPLLFSKRHSEEFSRCKASPISKEFLENYYSILIKTFGENLFRKTHPFVKIDF